MAVQKRKKNSDIQEHKKITNSDPKKRWLFRTVTQKILVKSWLEKKGKKMVVNN